MSATGLIVEVVQRLQNALAGNGRTAPGRVRQNELETNMTYDEAVNKVIEVITITLTEAGKAVPPMEKTTLLGGSLPLDSLELAVVVIRMREISGIDPFASGLVAFWTIGELAALYAK